MVASDAEIFSFDVDLNDKQGAMAKKSSNDGCVLLLVAGIFVFAISKCSNGNETSVSQFESPTATTDFTDRQSQADSTIKMYVVARKMNCLSKPSPNGSVTAQFDHGDAVSAGDARNGWLAVGRSGGDQCWAKASLLSEEQPEPLAIEEPAAPLRAFGAPTVQSGLSCGGKSVCRQMDSCEEAYHYLNQCGIGRLDGDGDGVPCESIC